MTFPRILPALILTSLLAACGGGGDTEPPAYMPTATAAATISVGAPAGTTADASAAPTSVAAASAAMPTPDCAAEGCASLRIIDGNAEAWRIDAARRAAVERMTQL